MSCEKSTRIRATENRSSHRLHHLKLANALLDFARIEAGRVRAVYEPTDLSCVGKLLELFLQVLSDQSFVLYDEDSRALCGVFHAGAALPNEFDQACRLSGARADVIHRPCF